MFPTRSREFAAAFWATFRQIRRIQKNRGVLRGIGGFSTISREFGLDQVPLAGGCGLPAMSCRIVIRMPKQGGVPVGLPG